MFILILPFFGPSCFVVRRGKVSSRVGTLILPIPVVALLHFLLQPLLLHLNPVKNPLAGGLLLIADRTILVADDFAVFIFLWNWVSVFRRTVAGSIPPEGSPLRLFSLIFSGGLIIMPVTTDSAYGK